MRIKFAKKYHKITRLHVRMVTFLISLVHNMNGLNFLFISFLFLSGSVFSHDKWEEESIGAKSSEYDYLVYAVTWQPTLCMLNNDISSCINTKPIFTTHGIWPYFFSNSDFQNRHPSYCTDSIGCTSGKPCKIDSSVLSHMLNDTDFKNITTENPVPLMMHEWEKHGTCYGKGQHSYFSDFKLMREVVTYNDSFKEYIGKSIHFNELKSLFPKNTSFRCATKDGKQLLFEVHYLIDADGSEFHLEKNLQIGEPCKNSEVLIPSEF
ncbi:ribonuclease [Escherichia coli]|nr:ribonuclease [Escherichia coli]